MVVGTIRFVDPATQELRGRVEVSIEGATVTLLSERDGLAHRTHVNARSARRIADLLEQGAALAEGGS